MCRPFGVRVPGEQCPVKSCLELLDRIQHCLSLSLDPEISCLKGLERPFAITCKLQKSTVNVSFGRSVGEEFWRCRIFWDSDSSSTLAAKAAAKTLKPRKMQ